MLILQENSVGISDGVADEPDDEGSRPAGSLYFDFCSPVESVAFDLIDIEIKEIGADRGYAATFYDENGDEVFRVGFDVFADPTHPLYSGATFGNNSANRTPTITAEAMGLQHVSFSRLEINLGGSGAVDSVTFATLLPDIPR